jgi:hypothetical protein
VPLGRHGVDVWTWLFRLTGSSYWEVPDNDMCEEGSVVLVSEMVSRISVGFEMVLMGDSWIVNSAEASSTGRDSFCPS